jgi:hypothetical protein
MIPIDTPIATPKPAIKHNAMAVGLTKKASGVRDAACSLAEGVISLRAGRFQIPGSHLTEARSK